MASLRHQLPMLGPHTDDPDILQARYVNYAPSPSPPPRILPEPFRIDHDDSVVPSDDARGTGEIVDTGDTCNTENHSAEHPAGTSIKPLADHKSHDASTNSPTGVFLCNFTGCNAPPFTLRYLLQSHALVHSSRRPYLCDVRGCPRSGDGEGFKRHNELKRHARTHQPERVFCCPFCSNGERKYPRADNLQRHVGSHHPDKKDDPDLLEELAQHQDGPSGRKRRRRMRQAPKTPRNIRDPLAANFGGSRKS